MSISRIFSRVRNGGKIKPGINDPVYLRRENIRLLGESCGTRNTLNNVIARTRSFYMIMR